jgi:anti-sigma factor RsiW
MNCKEVKPELVAYLDGELQDEVRSQIETHLKACAACRDERDALAATLKSVATLPATRPSSNLAEQFWTRFQAARQKGFKAGFLSLFKWPRPVWVGAAATACLLAAVLLVLPKDKPVEKAEADIAAHMDLFADYETIKNLDILEDLEYIEALDEV